MQQNQTNMKKLSIIFAILVAAFTFTACEYQNVYPKETIYATNSKTVDIHVASADWAYSSEGGYYYYTASVPALTKTIYDTGVITCYREYNHGTADAYQMNLPRVFPVVDSGSGEVYSQIVDFSFLVGQVEIAVTNSDLKYDLNTTPEAMDFRLNMMW